MPISSPQMHDDVRLLGGHARDLAIAVAFSSKPSVIWGSLAMLCDFGLPITRGETAPEQESEGANADEEMATAARASRYLCRRHASRSA